VLVFSNFLFFVHLGCKKKSHFSQIPIIKGSFRQPEEFFSRERLSYQRGTRLSQFFALVFIRGGMG